MNLQNWNQFMYFLNIVFNISLKNIKEKEANVIDFYSLPNSIIMSAYFSKLLTMALIALVSNVTNKYFQLRARIPVPFTKPMNPNHKQILALKLLPHKYNCIFYAL